MSESTTRTYAIQFIRGRDYSAYVSHQMNQSMKGAVVG
jgi:hypothetical protein